LRGGSRRGSGEGAGPAYVLDATALIVGSSEHLRGRLFTTPLVINEVRSEEIQVARTRALLDSGAVAARMPSQDSLREASRVAEEIGEMPRLSSTDLSIIALALDLKESFPEVLLITDDYSVQNVAESLGIEWRGLKYGGIRRGVAWEWVCPLCRRRYARPSGPTCPECRVQLSRVPKRRGP